MMRSRPSRRLWLMILRTGFPLLLFTAGLAGCSSPSPALYTVSMVPGPTQEGGPKLVAVREVSLAPYLQRQPIVRSSANNRIDVSANDWWGESPGAMLTRVLVDDLNQRLPGSTIIQERGAVSVTADTALEVDISQLDADAGGEVVLQAAVSIDRRGQKAPQPRRLRFAAHPGPGVAGEVSTISLLVGQLADELAIMLAAR